MNDFLNKKNLVELLEIKHTISKMKQLLKGISHRLDTTEENITDLEEFSSRNNPNRNTERKASFKIKRKIVQF